jgi:hypothetical protein
VVNLYVTPDGPRLARLAELAAQERLRIRVGLQLPLDQAPHALSMAASGWGGGAIVLLTAAGVSM